MSDSVDRVFVHALATVRRLPRTGSSTPPSSARLRLYGLYKQSMEGDVLAIMPRPTLPSASPDPQPPTSSNNTTGTNQNGNAVRRYASRDLRTREAQAEIDKWDAWHACAGMSRTEAKRRYITTLIETMKEYASGTQESRELISELEFVWNQIRSQSGSSEGEDDGDDKDSPNRRLERAGLKPTSSYASIPPGPGSQRKARSPPSRSGQRTSQSRPEADRTSSDPNRLRVLSPVSAGSADDIVEGEEVEETSGHQQPPFVHHNSTSTFPSDPEWRTRIESYLHQLSTEIAALREQLSANNLLSSSSYSPAGPISRRRRMLLRMGIWLRWFAWAAMRQVVVNTVIVAVLVLWGRWKGDRRVEAWAWRRWKDFRRILSYFGFGVLGIWDDAKGLKALPSHVHVPLPKVLKIGSTSSS